MSHNLVEGIQNSIRDASFTQTIGSIALLSLFNTRSEYIPCKIIATIPLFIYLFLLICSIIISSYYQRQTLFNLILHGQNIF